MKEYVKTENAPSAIGPYNQAVKVGNTVYISGQIPLTPTMELIEGDIQDETRQVFKNLQAICQAAGGDLSDIVKLTIFLVDMSHFVRVNEVMEEFFKPPYPARAAIGVKELPKSVNVEAEAILVLG